MKNKESSENAQMDGDSEIVFAPRAKIKSKIIQIKSIVLI